MVYPQLLFGNWNNSVTEEFMAEVFFSGNCIELFKVFRSIASLFGKKFHQMRLIQEISAGKGIFQMNLLAVIRGKRSQNPAH